MKKIYFIRHAQGYHNLSNNGHDNYHLRYPRLTVDGLNQCKDVKKYINHVDIVITSPLRRTLETSTVIFDNGHKIIAHELIKEVVSNPCDFREPIIEMIPHFQHIDFSNVNDNYDYNQPESSIDVHTRANIFFDYLSSSELTSIAVVSHGAFLREFFTLYGDQLKIHEPFWMPNCGIRIGTL